VRSVKLGLRGQLKFRFSLQYDTHTCGDLLLCVVLFTGV